MIVQNTCPVFCEFERIKPDTKIEAVHREVIVDSLHEKLINPKGMALKLKDGTKDKMMYKADHGIRLQHPLGMLT